MKRFLIAVVVMCAVVFLHTACTVQFPNGTKIGIAQVPVVVSETVVVAPASPVPHYVYPCCAYDYYYFGRLHRHHHHGHSDYDHHRHRHRR